MKTGCLLLLLLFSLGVQAQDSLFRCRVIDVSNGEPVGGATLSAADSNWMVVAGADGWFSISVKKIGWVICSAVGYEKKLVLLKQGQLQITLTHSPAIFNEVVVTGTMKTVLKTASPVPVEVYTPQFFRKNPSPALFESLQQVNGVRPQLNCNVCNTGDIHINGMEGPYTLVLIDGMPIVSSLSSVYGLSGIPMSMVERIEVVKGPASSLYGSEAIGGLINVITKNPQKAPLLGMDVSTTSWKEHSIELSVKSRPGKKVDLLTGISVFDYSQPFDKNHDHFTDVTLQKRFSVFNKFRWERKKDRVATAALRYLQEDRWGGDLKWNKTFAGTDSVYGETIQTHRFEAIGSWQLPWEGKWMLNGSYTYHQQDSYYGMYAFMAKQQVALAQLTWDHSWEKQDLLAGVVMKYHWYDDNTVATRDTLSLRSKPDKVLLPGVFIQDEIKLNNTQQLLVGLRMDYHPVHRGIFTPRIAWKISLPDKTTLRLNAGTGFRTVNLFTEDHAALTGARSVVIKNALQPERSYNVNLNALKTFSGSHGWITLDFSLWYTYFTNRILPDYKTNPNQIIYDNLDGYAYSTGTSVSASWAMTNGLKGHWGITLQKVRTIYSQQTNGNSSQPYLTEPWSSNWSVSYAIMPWRLSLDYSGNIYGPMLLPLLSASDPRPAHSPVWSVHSLQFSRKWGPKWELYAGIKNLFDWTPGKITPFLIARSEDPFDKKVVWGADGQVIPSPGNPYALTFDPNYVFAPNQGRRGYFGIRFTLGRE